jgi:hypothetical protein
MGKFLPIFFFLSVSCASISQDEQSLDLTSTSDIELKAIPFKLATGIAEYSYKKQKFNAEWIACSTKAKSKTMLVLHQDKAGFAKNKFCDGWIAQVFMNEGYQVLTVNRPGFEKSTGIADFSGKQSVAAIHMGIQKALASTPQLGKVVGIWGYSSGAIAASLFAKDMGRKKEMTDLKFLLLGGGIYDLEETYRVTKNAYLKEEIAAIHKTGGDTALEERSVAYDVEGLTSTIFMYHGKQDSAVPHTQAQAFFDTLQSSEYKADLQILEGISHEIPTKHHMKVLQVLARSAKGVK